MCRVVPDGRLAELEGLLAESRLEVARLKAEADAAAKQTALSAAAFGVPLGVVAALGTNKAVKILASAGIK